MDGYVGSVEQDGDRYVMNDGEWGIIEWASDDVGIIHQRNDDNQYLWSYSYADMTDLDGDDRGANIGLEPENPNGDWVNGGRTVKNGQRNTMHTGDPGGSGF